MLDKEQIKEIIKEQKQFFLNVRGACERSILASAEFWQLVYETAEIIIVTGVRRSGKSFLLKLIWQEIKKRGKLSDGQCLYLNFEDERLINFQAADFQALLESYGELDEPASGKIYLFFDEIQSIKGWDKFLHRLREDKRYKVFVTGSNATLLSQEISSRLTGRNIQVRLYPFSWQEFLAWKLPRWRLKDIYDQEAKIKVLKYFQEYLRVGGFPEVFLTGQTFLLQEYLKNIVYRDILLRYKIRYQSHLREMTQFLINNTGGKTSLKSIAQATKIKNINTVKNYLHFLESSFLFESVPMYSYSYKQQVYNPRKTYLCDLGLYNEMSFKFSRNRGQILENFVFNELQKAGERIYYGYEAGRGEVDFALAAGGRVSALIQVSAEVADPLTKAREIKGLAQMMAKFKLKTGLVITYDFEAEEKIIGGRIIFKPAWKYFLR